MSTITGQTNNEKESAVFGRNDATVTASAPGGSGVFGLTLAPDGVGVFGANNSPEKGRGVQGNGPEAGIGGYSENGTGIVAFSKNGNGLLTTTDAAAKSALFASNNSTGVVPEGGVPAGNGVFGLTTVNGGTGVFGANNSSKGRGIQGNGPDAGVGGYSENGAGIIAFSKNGDGLFATTDAAVKSALFAANNSKGDASLGGAPSGNGVFGLTTVNGGTGVFGANNSSKGRGVQGNGPDVGVGGYSENGVGILGQGKTAGRFEGNVHVTGNLTSDGDIFLTNADFAEDFDIIGDAYDAGTVMVLSQNGGLEGSTKAYDKKVAGILSGAGNYKPGIVLDHHTSKNGRQPLAMVGKAYCKVDADTIPIEIGDLLTTSDVPGHAMKATDCAKAFGTVIGKALQPMDKGKGLIAVLVSLQ